MRTFVLSTVAILIFLAAICLQQAMYLHCDVSYLIEVANQMRMGGQYGNQILETNPPMILYLSLPMIYVANYFALPIAIGCRIIVFAWILISLVLSIILLRRLIHERFLFWSFFLAIEAVLLFLPANQFGQREHFFVMMMLPYLWLACCRLENISIGNFLAILVGVIASIGFAMKPYFLPPLILVELYLIIRKRSLLAWMRPEVLAIIAGISIYVITTYIYFPNYFTVLMPLLNLFYFAALHESLGYMFSNSIVLYGVASLVCYLILRRRDRYRSFHAVLALATLGTMLTFLLTQTTWYYHLLPAFSMSVLLFVFILSEFSDSGTPQGIILYIFASLLILYLPIRLVTLISLEELKTKRDGAYHHLIQYVQSQPGPHSVICFSANSTADCFPLTTETNSIHASRYPFLWWIRSLRTYQNANQLTGKNKLGADYLVNSLVEDLNNQKPRWIIINRDHSARLLGPSFDFINFLSQYPTFARAIKPYHHVTTIDYYDVYSRDKA